MDWTDYEWSIHKQMFSNPPLTAGYWDRKLEKIRGKRLHII